MEITSKNNEQQQHIMGDEKEKANQQVEKQEEIKKNPDPRANANLPEDAQKSNGESQNGVGSEITDGEDG